jgi:hypothetical protein
LAGDVGRLPFVDHAAVLLLIATAACSTQKALDLPICTNQDPGPGCVVPLCTNEQTRLPCELDAEVTICAGCPTDASPGKFCLCMPPNGSGPDAGPSWSCMDTAGVKCQ